MIPKRPRGLISVALLTLLALCGCSLAQRPSPRPTFGPPPTLAPDATPLPTPAPCSGQAPPDAGGVVAELTDFPFADALEVTDVAWTGTRFVAVGFRALGDGGYDGPRQGIVWTSCDGVGWQEVIDPALQYLTPLAVAPLGDSVFIHGRFSTCGPIYEDDCADVAEAGNVLMRSTGGGPWQRLAQDPEMQAAYDLAFETVGNRLVAHGAADDDDLTYTLWLSDDGESWRKTSELAGMNPIDSLVAQGEGMIAFGTVYLDELEDTQLVIAQSADGTAFASVAAPQVPGATVMDSVAGPGGFAAVGSGYPDVKDFGFLALALSSVDGTTWQEATNTDESFVDSELSEVFALPDGSGYVAVGFTLADDDFSQRNRLWTSADGRSWSALAEFGDLLSVDTTAEMGSTGLVVFSADEEETDELVSSVSVYFAPVGELAP